MENKDANQLLVDIRDEMREMNSQVKWLIDQAKDAMEREEPDHAEQILVAAEIENKKSKREWIGVLVLLSGLFAWAALEKFGYL